jgi:hypothetical protein
MKKHAMIKLFVLLFVLFPGIGSKAQNPVNWSEKQLIEPADLSNAVATKEDIPVIISVGPGVTIPNSVKVGPVNNAEGLEKLKAELNTIDRDKKIVIYCGCCPFEHCPNVRPAIDALKEMKFTNYYLLNLSHNIKQDWIDKGYPVSGS